MHKDMDLVWIYEIRAIPRKAVKWFYLPYCIIFARFFNGRICRVWIIHMQVF